MADFLSEAVPVWLETQTERTHWGLLSSLLLWRYYFHSPARRGRGTPPTKIVFLGSKGWEPSITKSLSLRFHGRICTWKKVVYLVLTSFPSTPNENKMTQDKPNVCAFYNIQVPNKIRLITKPDLHQVPLSLGQATQCLDTMHKPLVSLKGSLRQILGFEFNSFEHNTDCRKPITVHHLVFCNEFIYREQKIRKIFLRITHLPGFWILITAPS